MLIARGVEDIALKHGFQVLIGNSDNSLEKAKGYINTFNSHNCIGIISTAFDHHSITELIATQSLPVVFVDRLNKEQNGISTNHYRGGELQAQIVINGDARMYCYCMRTLLLKHSNYDIKVQSMYWNK